MLIGSRQQNPMTAKPLGFTSIKSEIRTGEDILKQFKREIGYLKSSSKDEIRLLNHDLDSNPLYKEFNDYTKGKGKRVWDKTEALSDEIDNNRNEFMNNNKFYCFKAFADALKDLLKKTGKANCWEDSIIVNEALREKGLNPKNFQIKMFIDGEEYANHYSTVFNLNDGADLSKPSTWGTKAVIVDAWAGFSKQANDAISLLKQTLEGNYKNCTFEFENLEAINKFH